MVRARDARSQAAVVRWLETDDVGLTEVAKAMAAQAHPYLAARKAARAIERYMAGYCVSCGSSFRVQVTFERVLPWCRETVDRILSGDTKKRLAG